MRTTPIVRGEVGGAKKKGPAGQVYTPKKFAKLRTEWMSIRCVLVECQVHKLMNCDIGSTARIRRSHRGESRPTVTHTHQPSPVPLQAVRLSCASPSTGQA